MESQDSINATLKTDMKYIKDSIREINEKLDAKYVTFAQFDEHLKADRIHEDRLNKHDEEMVELKSFQDTLVGKMWGIGILAGLVIGIIEFAANHYLK